MVERVDDDLVVEFREKIGGLNARQTAAEPSLDARPTFTELITIAKCRRRKRVRRRRIGAARLVADD